MNSEKEEVYHLSPLGVLDTDAHHKLQRYMLLLKEVWKLDRDETVAVVLEEGRLHFRHLHAAPLDKGSKKKKKK